LEDKLNTGGLEQRIRACQKAYYAGNSVMSDAEFDRLWDRLARINPASPVLSRIGSDSTGSFPKARHIVPMGSQDKIRHSVQLRYWLLRAGSPLSYSVQFKLDGAGLELQYRDGLFVRAVTRGDGVTGSDITPNALRMGGVLSVLDTPFTGGIRGEVMLPRAKWLEKYNGRKTSRDIGNGIMLRKDGRGCEDLVFIAYDAAASGNDGFFTGETGKIMWLRERGFSVTETREFSDPEAAIAYLDAVTTVRLSLPVDIDGLVIKDCRTDMNDLRRPRPRKQIAFKPCEEKEW
jgi:DNA ligase (NAD+)